MGVRCDDAGRYATAGPFKVRAPGDFTVRLRAEEEMVVSCNEAGGNATVRLRNQVGIRATARLREVLLAGNATVRLRAKEGVADRCNEAGGIAAVRTRNRAGRNAAVGLRNFFAGKASQFDSAARKKWRPSVTRLGSMLPREHAESMRRNPRRVAVFDLPTCPFHFGLRLCRLTLPFDFAARLFSVDFPTSPVNFPMAPVDSAVRLRHSPLPLDVAL